MTTDTTTAFNLLVAQLQADMRRDGRYHVDIGLGTVAVIDSGDMARVSGINWHLHSEGYAIARVCGKKVYMHRWLVNPPEDMTVDHINGDRLDNRRCNLRIATRSQNYCNRAGKVATSAYKGVSWHKATKTWRATISADKRQRSLGYFHSEIEAARAYDEAAKSLHGEFARLNFPEVS
jgi:hypothetical protein